MKELMKLAAKPNQQLLKPWTVSIPESIKPKKIAVATLKRVPPSKFYEAKNTGYLAATLAAFYILADEDTEFGFNTKTRVDNFIAGIQDDSF